MLSAVLFWAAAQGVSAQDVVFRLKNTLSFDRTREWVEVQLPAGTTVEGKKLVDEQGTSVAYELSPSGDALRFLASVPGGSTAAYTLTDGEALVPTRCTYVAQKMPGSRNDIAWENDRAAYRMYSHQLQTSEPNTANGVDLWMKKKAEPVIDAMYGLSNYHSESAYGVDAYSVNGKTLGAGGVAAYADGRLWMHDAYDECRILENGPLRAAFELVYNNVVVDGSTYTKTLRIETRAGGLLNKAVVRYDGPAKEMKMAVCVYKHTDMSSVTPDGVEFTDIPGLIGYAENKSEGTVTSPSARFFLGAYIPGRDTETLEVSHHLTVMCDYTPGTELEYYFGGGWNIFPAGDYATDDEWFDALARFRRQVEQPLTETSMTTLPRKAEVLDILHRVNSHWQQTHPTHGDFFWNRAVYHTGNMEAYAATGEAAYLDYSTAWAERNNWWGATGTDPSKWVYTYGEGGNHVLFGDCQICFQVYADLYLLSPEERKIARTLEVMNYEVNTEAVDYLWWVDGLYMVMPVLTRLHKITGDDIYLEKMYAYWKYAHELMYDEEENLYYRDAKYIYPNHKTNSGKKDFWARGDGWIFAAFGRVLADLPLTDPHRDEYIDVYRKMAASVAAAQQPEGHWTRSMLDPAYAPGYETSGTALFTYGYLWGINNGILSEREYGAVVERAWNYLTTVALQDDGTVGYVQPIGEKADPNQSVSRTSTADFGVGAFLLAASKMSRYAVGESEVPTLRLSSVTLTEANRLTATFSGVPDASEVQNLAHYSLNGAPVEAEITTDGGRTVHLTFARPLGYGRFVFGVEGLPSAEGGEMVGVQKRTFVRTVPLTPSPAGVTVTAIGAQSGNPAKNVLDNNASTRWSQAGLKQWIRFDLGTTQTVEAVDIAFYSGSQRSSYFDIEVSTDGQTYTTVLAGCESSGLTDGMERYLLPEKQAARYVRLMCNGNSAGGDNWNSITEARVRVADATLADLTVPAEIYTDLLLPESTSASTPLQWTSSNPDVLSGSGLVTLPIAEAVSVTLTATASSSERTFEVNVMPREPARNLQLFYTFEAEDMFNVGTTRRLTDHSGHERHGQLMGKAVADGTLNLTANTATGFSGNGYLLVPKGTLDSLRSYTVMFTARPSSLDKQPRFYDFGAASGHSLFLRANALAVGVKYNSGTTTLLNAPKQLSTGMEQQLTVTFDARTHTTRLYVNGELATEGTGLTYEPCELARLKADTRNYLGRTQWWDSSVKNDNPDYCGTMDNFRLYGMSLTPDEIRAIATDDATGVATTASWAGFELMHTVLAAGEQLEIHVPADAPKGCVLEVLDTRGRKVTSTVLTPGVCRHPLHTASGLYIVRVTHNGASIFAEKLLIR